MVLKYGLENLNISESPLSEWTHSQKEFLSVHGLSFVFEYDYPDFKSLIVDFMYQELDTKLALCFFTNCLDLDYFYDNKLYTFLEIDYKELLARLYFKEPVLNNYSPESYIFKVLAIMEKINLHPKLNTLFIKKLDYIKTNYTTSSWRVSDMLTEYDIHYNKFLLSIYLDCPKYLFEDFSEFIEDEAFETEIPFVYTSLLSNFGRCGYLDNKTIISLYTEMSFVFQSPLSFEDKETHIAYLSYLDTLFNYLEYSQETNPQNYPWILSRKVTVYSFYIILKNKTTFDERKRIRKLYSRFLKLTTGTKKLSFNIERLRFSIISVYPWFFLG